jgi:PKD repeat protein
MNTIDYHRMRRALAIVATGLALGGLAGPASGQPMYRMQALGSGGGVPAQAVQNSPIVSNGNCTLSWYGTMGWYTILGATNLAGPWNNLSSVEATGYAWQTTLPDPDTSNGYSFFQLSQANSYAGSQACGGCHGTQYNSWTTTVHANAYNALVASHEQNASCVLCHTVGFNQPTGFMSNSPVASLEGVGCEDCHGPAGWHKNSDHAVILPAISIDPTICGSCHNGHNPQWNEFTNSPHYLVEPDVAYGFTGGVYYTNTVVVSGKTLYGYYLTTNSLGAFVTNACSGILNSSYVPGSSVDPGQARQASCGICHSGATRMAMINDYASRLSGVTNPLVLPLATDSGAWGPACADCHDPHGLNPSPVLGTFTNIVAGVSTNIGFGVVATNWVQLRNPLWSSNYYTMATVTDARTDSSGNPYYMNTTFASMYNPSVNVCGQCHNTRGARWDGRSYALVSNSVPVTNLIISAAYNYTYTTNYNLYGQIIGIVTNIYPTGGTVTNTVLTNVWAYTTALTTNITGFSRAPHLSPQYNMLIGILEPDYLNTTNGSSIYTNGVLNNGLGIYATHSGIKSRSPYNTNQCVTCHVPIYTGPNGNVTGHTFAMDPNGCALGGCHTTGYPDWVDYQLTTTNSLRNVVALLNQWANDKAPAILGSAYNTSLLNSWEYSTAGSLASLTNIGPSTANQLLLPTNILQARFDAYMVFSDGSFGVHNPTLIPLLLSDAETKVLSQYPIAGFKANTVLGLAGSTGLKVTFSSLGTGLSGYNWSFGDGNTSTLANPINYYQNVGTYTVTLTATNSLGVTETLVRTNYITVVPPAPAASFTVTPMSGAHPLTVNCANTAASTGNYLSIVIYNGTITRNSAVYGVVAPTATYTFTNAGTYPIVETISTAGASTTYTNTVTVQ